MRNIVEDLSTLTTIPEATLTKLLQKVQWCICDDVQETALSGESVTEIDIGLGTLLIVVEDNSIKYKFIPSKKLEDDVRETLLNKKNPLQINIENSLVSKIMHTYKDIL